jgi:ACS family hexuronate transporter-like MFS transporter
LAFGLLFTGSSIGAMVAGKLAVGLDAKYGFQWAFVGTALVGSLWIPAWLLVTRGAGLDAGARTETKEDDKPRAPWLETVTSPPVLRAMIAVLGSAPAIMFVMNWTSQYLVEAWGTKKGDVGNYLVVPPLVFDIGAVVFGFLASRREKDARKTHVDLLLVATVLAACLALAPLAPNRDVAIAIFAAAICGGGGIYVLVTADMLARVPVEKTSSAGGMTAAAQSLAHIIASPVIGAAIDRTHGYTSVLIALGLIVVPTSIAFVLWPGLSKS